MTLTLRSGEVRTGEGREECNMGGGRMEDEKERVQNERRKNKGNEERERKNEEGQEEKERR